MRSISKFWRDRRGISAIEFSLILPVLTTVLVLGFDGWMMINQSQDMRTSVQTGARYYQIGGSVDTDARTAALAAWVNKPAAGDVQVTRACFCGTTANNCASSCASGTASSYVTLTATSTFSGMVQSKALTESEVVRVQ